MRLSARFRRVAVAYEKPTAGFDEEHDLCAFIDQHHEEIYDALRATERRKPEPAAKEAKPDE